MNNLNDIDKARYAANDAIFSNVLESIDNGVDHDIMLDEFKKKGYIDIEYNRKSPDVVIAKGFKFIDPDTGEATKKIPLNGDISDLAAIYSGVYSNIYINGQSKEKISSLARDYDFLETTNKIRSIVGKYKIFHNIKYGQITEINNADNEILRKNQERYLALRFLGLIDSEGSLDKIAELPFLDENITYSMIEKKLFENLSNEHKIAVENKDGEKQIEIEKKIYEKFVEPIRNEWDVPENLHYKIGNKFYPVLEEYEEEHKNNFMSGLKKINKVFDNNYDFDSDVDLATIAHNTAASILGKTGDLSKVALTAMGVVGKKFEGNNPLTFVRRQFDPNVSNNEKANEYRYFSQHTNLDNVTRKLDATLGAVKTTGLINLSKIVLGNVLYSLSPETFDGWINNNQPTSPKNIEDYDETFLNTGSFYNAEHAGFIRNDASFIAKGFLNDSDRAVKARLEYGEVGRKAAEKSALRKNHAWSSLLGDAASLGLFMVEIGASSGLAGAAVSGGLKATKGMSALNTFIANPYFLRTLTMGSIAIANKTSEYLEASNLPEEYKQQYYKENTLGRIGRDVAMSTAITMASSTLPDVVIRNSSLATSLSKLKGKKGFKNISKKVLGYWLPELGTDIVVDEVIAPIITRNDYFTDKAGIVVNLMNGGGSMSVQDAISYSLNVLAFEYKGIKDNARWINNKVKVAENVNSAQDNIKNRLKYSDDLISMINNVSEVNSKLDDKYFKELESKEKLEKKLESVVKTNDSEEQITIQANIEKHEKEIKEIDETTSHLRNIYNTVSIDKIEKEQDIIKKFIKKDNETIDQYVERIMNNENLSEIGIDEKKLRTLSANERAVEITYAIAKKSDEISTSFVNKLGYLEKHGISVSVKLGEKTGITIENKGDYEKIVNKKLGHLDTFLKKYKKIEKESEEEYLSRIEEAEDIPKEIKEIIKNSKNKLRTAKSIIYLYAAEEFQKSVVDEIKKEKAEKNKETKDKEIEKDSNSKKASAEEKDSSNKTDTEERNNLMNNIVSDSKSIASNTIQEKQQDNNTELKSLANKVVKNLANKDSNEIIESIDDVYSLHRSLDYLSKSKKSNAANENIKELEKDVIKNVEKIKDNGTKKVITKTIISNENFSKENTNKLKDLLNEFNNKVVVDHKSIFHRSGPVKIEGNTDGKNIEINRQDIMLLEKIINDKIPTNTNTLQFVRESKYADLYLFKVLDYILGFDNKKQILKNIKSLYYTENKLQEMINNANKNSNQSKLLELEEILKNKKSIFKIGGGQKGDKSYILKKFISKIINVTNAEVKLKEDIGLKISNKANYKKIRNHNAKILSKLFAESIRETIKEITDNIKAIKEEDEKTIKKAKEDLDNFEFTNAPISVDSIKKLIYENSKKDIENSFMEWEEGDISVASNARAAALISKNYEEFTKNLAEMFVIQKPHDSNEETEYTSHTNDIQKTFNKHDFYNIYLKSKSDIETANIIPLVKNVKGHSNNKIMINFNNKAMIEIDRYLEDFGYNERIESKYLYLIETDHIKNDKDIKATIESIKSDLELGTKEIYIPVDYDAKKGVLYEIIRFDNNDTYRNFRTEASNEFLKNLDKYNEELNERKKVIKTVPEKMQKNLEKLIPGLKQKLTIEDFPDVEEQIHRAIVYKSNPAFAFLDFEDTIKRNQAKKHNLATEKLQDLTTVFNSDEYGKLNLILNDELGVNRKGTTDKDQDGIAMVNQKKLKQINDTKQIKAFFDANIKPMLEVYNLDESKLTIGKNTYDGYISLGAVKSLGLHDFFIDNGKVIVSISLKNAIVKPTKSHVGDLKLGSQLLSIDSQRPEENTVAGIIVKEIIGAQKSFNDANRQEKIVKSLDLGSKKAISSTIAEYNPEIMDDKTIYQFHKDSDEYKHENHTLENDSVYLNAAALIQYGYTNQINDNKYVFNIKDFDDKKNYLAVFRSPISNRHGLTLSRIDGIVSDDQHIQITQNGNNVIIFTNKEYEIKSSAPRIYATLTAIKDIYEADSDGDKYTAYQIENSGLELILEARKNAREQSDMYIEIKKGVEDILEEAYDSFSISSKTTDNDYYLSKPLKRSAEKNCIGQVVSSLKTINIVNQTPKRNSEKFWHKSTNVEGKENTAKKAQTKSGLFYKKDNEIYFKIIKYDKPDKQKQVIYKKEEISINDFKDKYTIALDEVGVPFKLKNEDNDLKYAYSSALVHSHLQIAFDIKDFPGIESPAIRDPLEIKREAITKKKKYDPKDYAELSITQIKLNEFNNEDLGVITVTDFEYDEFKKIKSIAKLYSDKLSADEILNNVKNIGNYFEDTDRSDDILQEQMARIYVEKYSDLVKDMFDKQLEFHGKFNLPEFPKDLRDRLLSRNNKVENSTAIASKAKQAVDSLIPLETYARIMLAKEYFDKNENDYVFFSEDTDMDEVFRIFKKFLSSYTGDGIYEISSAIKKISNNKEEFKEHKKLPLDSYATFLKYYNSKGIDNKDRRELEYEYEKFKLAEEDTNILERKLDIWDKISEQSLNDNITLMTLYGIKSSNKEINISIQNRIETAIQKIMSNENVNRIECD